MSWQAEIIFEDLITYWGLGLARPIVYLNVVTRYWRTQWLAVVTSYLLASSIT